jgi:hypothetical protein
MEPGADGSRAAQRRCPRRRRLHTAGASASRLEVGRQILRSRHGRPRNHKDVLVLESGRDLEPQEVIRRVHPATLEAGILDGQPVPADDCHQNRARFEFMLDDVEEVLAWSDAIGVFEIRRAPNRWRSGGISART